MLQSEKRSLIRFLVIYLTSTFLLFSLAAWIFYTSTKHHIFDSQKETLKYEAKHMRMVLRQLHQSDAPLLPYPHKKEIQTAIYDLDGGYIFGSFAHPKALASPIEEGSIRYVEKLQQPYYLGAAILLLERPLNREPLVALVWQIVLFMVVAGIFFAILGYFLGRLFIAPMRQAIDQMDHFIQDTTHELNTPISTILTNIEMIETFEKCPKAKEELQRIEIASKTLSRIYDDLTYLNLNHTRHREIRQIDMGQLVGERMVYFSAMAEAKRLEVKASLMPGVICCIDRNDALRLIDNLLSNAIKYNRPHGLLEVEVTQEKLVVKDTGIGIKPQALKVIMQRFVRDNKSEGGFGIGLDIVNNVVHYYGLGLSIDSVEGQGTVVSVMWKEKEKRCIEG